jgi:plasmid stability protein
MATITIRQLDESTKANLRIQAARNGRSMEAEAREILTSAVKKSKSASKPKSGKALWDSIRSRFEPLGGVELELPVREVPRDPPVFE